MSPRKSAKAKDQPDAVDQPPQPDQPDQPEAIKPDQCVAADLGHHICPCPICSDLRTRN